MTPSERDPRGGLSFLHRDIGPRLGPEARRRWRRVGAVLCAAASLIAIVAIVGLTYVGFGPLAALAHLAVIGMVLRLVGTRTSDAPVLALAALCGVGFVAFFVTLVLLGDESAPGYRAAVGRATLLFRIPLSLTWAVGAPTVVRRLWRGEPPAPPGT